MKENDFPKQLDDALDHLRADPGTGGLDGFERKVWSEIALHDERFLSRLRQVVADGFPSLPTPVAMAVSAMTILLGVAAAYTQATSYEKQVSRSMEERYVASIHPVLRSEAHEDMPDHF